MTHDVVVSIINYRTGALTIACAQSVLAASDRDVHVVITDNDSGDGSAEEIAEWISTLPDEEQITLVRSPRNTGFSGGHNQGMAAANGRYYLLLNSDAVLRPGFFSAILSSADSHPEAGLIAPRLEGEDGTAQISGFRFHRPLSEFERAACSGPISRALARYRVAVEDAAPRSDIEWASFACILLRAQMVEAIGPMDEGYFLYFEDAEYSLRALRSGWPIAFAPEAVAVHFRGGSGPVKALDRARERLPRYYYRSRARFLYQMHGWLGLFAANLLWHAGRAVALSRWLIGKPVPKAARLEARDIWTSFLTPLKVSPDHNDPT